MSTAAMMCQMQMQGVGKLLGERFIVCQMGTERELDDQPVREAVLWVVLVYPHHSASA